MGPPLIFRTTDSSVIPLKRSVLWPSLQIFAWDEKVQNSQLSTDWENMRNRFTNPDMILHHWSTVGISQDSSNSDRLLWTTDPFAGKEVFKYRNHCSLAVSRSIGTVLILCIRKLNYVFRIESRGNHLLRTTSCDFWFYSTTRNWSRIWRLSI